MHYFENFKNFKNFKDGKLNVMEPVSILLGRNGAGKSNVIEAIELLAQIAQGRPLYEITDIGKASGNAFELRGGLSSCVHNDGPKSDGIGDLNQNNEFTLAFSASYLNKDVEYRVTIDGNKHKINAEELKWGNDVIFSALKKRSEEFLSVTYNNFSKGGKKPVDRYPCDISILFQYSNIFVSMMVEKEIKGVDKKSRTSQRLQDSFRLVDLLKRYLKSSYVFDVHPKAMRGYERIGQEVLNRDGSNLSSALYSLSQGDESKKKILNDIFNNLNKLPDEPYSKMEFAKTSLNDVMLSFSCRDGSVVDARVLSDGTLRALAILAALETVPKTSRIIIEEMDNGIHPSRVKVLLDAIVEASNRRDLNVLITTHNPATLDALGDNELKSVYVCYYDNVEKTSKILPLKEVPDVDILLERGTLGDLVTKRVLEEHLVPNYAEERKSKALAWLESMQ